MKRPTPGQPLSDGAKLAGAESAADREALRLQLQVALDAQKSRAERNRLGQFATPTALALDLLRYAKRLLPSRGGVRFLDPALGTGAFYSALRAVFPASRISGALGFERDPHYGEPAAALWGDAGLTLRVQDFTQALPVPEHTLLICNPPYVRHHHLSPDEKQRLAQRTWEASGMRPGGLTGLYGYFLGLCHAWMADGGLAGWLIPSEFMDVNYGAELRRYLLTQVTLLHIHRFDPREVQFADALVSSAVVWLRKSPPPPEHTVRFSFGGTLEAPAVCREVPAAELQRERKWSRFPQAEPRAHHLAPTLGDFFQIRRGLATGDNAFFILSERALTAHRLPAELFTPILPSPRDLPLAEVQADDAGLPILPERLFLLDTRLSEAVIAADYPTLHSYLQAGRARDLHLRYLCRHRTPWYAQEKRPAAPIVCTYLGRSDGGSRRPFRFIRNRSRATVANVYLAMYPKPRLLAAMAQDPRLIDRVWALLQEIPTAQLLGEGRVYGGGLHKLEPRELSNVAVPALAAWVQELVGASAVRELDETC